MTSNTGVNDVEMQPIERSVNVINLVNNSTWLIISLKIFQTYSRPVEKRNVGNDCEIYPTFHGVILPAKFGIASCCFLFFAPHVAGIRSEVSDKHCEGGLHSIQSMATSKRCRGIYGLNMIERSSVLLMAEILHHLTCMKVVNGIFTISTGAGFLPSTV